MESDKAIVKSINSLLNSSKTRLAGLKLLNCHLSACSEENLVEFCINWMQNCCKSEETIKGTDLAVETLSSLFRISGNYPQLNKQVSFFISNRFFDHFLKYFKDSGFGWKCMKICFLYYRGPCGFFQENIEKHLLCQIKEHKKISQDISDCIALLPSLGSGGNEGINYKINWINQLVKYVHINHSILNDLFVDIEEVKNYDATGHTYESLQKNPTFDYLIIQLYNHSSVLCSMLLNSYPTPKCIPTDVVMNIIHRVLSINTSVFAKSHTTSLLFLKKVLPEIFMIFFKLLNSLIALCGNQLLPYSSIICKFIKQTLEWTQLEINSGRLKDFEHLRILVYNTICNWLVVTKSSSNFHSISNEIIQYMISDIDFRVTITFLKGKQIGSEIRHEVNAKPNACLCYSALRALQCLLKFFGVMLQPKDHKCLQESVVKLLINIYKNDPIEAPEPYNSSKCRKYLFSVLLELILQTNPKCFPPTQFAFCLFKKGENDPSLEVSEFCCFNLSALIVLIHQQYSNGPFLFIETMNGATGNNLNLGVKNIMTKKIRISKTNQVVEEPNSLIEKPMEIEENETQILTKKIQSQTIDGRSNFDDANFVESSKNVNESLIELESTSEIFTSSSPKKTDVETHQILTKKLDTSFKNQNKTALIKSNKSLMPHKTISENNDKTNLLGFEGEPTQKKSKLSENLESEIKILPKENEGNNLLQQQKVNKNINTEAHESEKIIEKNSSFSHNSKNLCMDNNLEKEELTYETSINVETFKTTDESKSKKSVTPDLPEEGNHLDHQKRYFLRSKTPFTEDTKEPLKRTSSLDSLRQTSNRNLGKNISTIASKPTTRASSKVQNNNNKENSSSQRRTKEEDEILKTFDDSTVD